MTSAVRSLSAARRARELLLFPLLALCLHCSETDTDPLPTPGDPSDDGPPAADPDVPTEAGTLPYLGHVSADAVCALTGDRLAIYCWGWNNTKHLRRDQAEGTVTSPRRLDLEGLPPGPYRRVVTVPAKTSVLTDDGRVFVAGDPTARGALGVGDDKEHASFVELARGNMPAGVKVTEVAVDAFGGCVLGDDKEIYCWGDRNRIPGADQSIPGPVLEPTRIHPGDAPRGFTSVAVSANTLCARSSGKAFCWSTSNVPKPIPLGALDLDTKIGIVRMNDDLACTPAEDGEIYCWGTAEGRRFGDGNSEFRVEKGYVRVSRANVPAGVRFVDVAVGGLAGASCGLGSDGWAYCWGDGQDGSVGDGDVSEHEVLEPVPVLRGEVPEGVTFRDIECGKYHCNAAGTDGFIYSWGFNESSVLAIPHTEIERSATPVRMRPLVD